MIFIASLFLLIAASSALFQATVIFQQIGGSSVSGLLNITYQTNLALYQFDFALTGVDASKSYSVAINTLGDISDLKSGLSTGDVFNPFGYPVVGTVGSISSNFATLYSGLISLNGLYAEDIIGRSVVLSLPDSTIVAAGVIGISQNSEATFRSSTTNTASIAVLQSPGSIVSGIVYLVPGKAADSVRIVGTITHTDGADATRGFHIHQFGDLSDTAAFLTTGSHWNPLGNPHDLPENNGPRHAGDLGNLQFKKGVAQIDITLQGNGLTISGKNTFLGRALQVHANPDDASQPTGNAGGRLAAGVIGITNTVPSY